MASPLWFVKLVKIFYTARFPLKYIARRSPLLKKIIDPIFFKDDVIFFLPKEDVVASLIYQSPHVSISQHETIQPASYQPEEDSQEESRTESRTRQVVFVGEPIPAPENIVLPSQIVIHFIEQASHHWIMNRCLCRDALHCKDFPVDLGCLFLGEAVQGIHPELGRMVSKEEAIRHIRRAEQSGLVHMIGRNKTDSIWMGVQPGNKLLTICSCCPCCCLFRVVTGISPAIDAKIHKLPGIKVVVNPAVCVGCGACVTSDICFTGALSIQDGMAFISNDCRGCGRCVEVCPAGAINITFEENDYVRQVICRINEKVDVS